MCSEYAKPVKRMNTSKKWDAEDAAKKFAEEIGKEFDCIEKDSSGNYCVTYKDSYGYVGASIVTCPHCGVINVCWGEYGDPEIEITICNGCNEEFSCEPF